MSVIRNFAVVKYLNGIEPRFDVIKEAQVNCF